jgi:predicted Zn finger-like uncharacterized protein
MNVTCPNCATVYRVDPAKVPEAGVRARCAVCSAVFAVNREERGAGALASAGPAPVASAHAGTAPVAEPPAARVPPPAPAAQAAPTPPPVRPAPAPTPVTASPSAPAPSPAPTSAPSASPRPVAPPASRPMSPPVAPAPSGLAPRPAAPAAQRPMSPIPPVPLPSATPATPPPSAPARPGPAATGPGGRPANPFLSQDPSAKARRLARALVSDIVVYHPAKRQEGIRDGNLRELFEEEIKKSWEEYTEQVGREVAESTGYFREALNEILAGGRQVF